MSVSATMEQREIRFLQGNEACVAGALYAGCSFFAGYPITPSSEVAEGMSEELPGRGGMFIQMEDEISAMAAVIGASLTGAKALTATSGPGFSLKQENIGFACMTEIPCVIVNVMRGGPSTGLPTLPSQSDIMQVRWGTHGDHAIIALAPATVREMFTETVRAFNLSERYRTPVVLLSDEIVAHMRERIDMPVPGEIAIIERERPTCEPSAYLPYAGGGRDVPPMAIFGSGYRYHVTGLTHDESGFSTMQPDKIQREQERMVNKIERHTQEFELNEEVATDGAEILLVAAGSSARSAKTAIRQVASRVKAKVGLFRPITLWPFPSERLATLARSARAIIVPEMNLGQLRFEVERCARRDVPVYGVNVASGEPVSPKLIAAKIEEVAR
jgi:2-oxoglutarate/2-oxoacid ferredoxin oxidoreductase subunit alpha